MGVALVAVFRGYRHGFVGQTAGVLGVAFGISAARVGAPELYGHIREMFPSWEESVTGTFSYDLLAAGLIFTASCLLFGLVGGVLGAALSVLRTGTLNALAGALFTLLKYLIFLSLGFNALVAFNPRSQLMRSATADDGNIVQGVMLLAPALLGTESVSELAHRIQLLDARSISCVGGAGIIRKPTRAGDVISPTPTIDIQQC